MDNISQREQKAKKIRFVLLVVIVLLTITCIVATILVSKYLFMDSCDLCYQLNPYLDICNQNYTLWNTIIK